MSGENRWSKLNLRCRPAAAPVTWWGGTAPGPTTLTHDLILMVLGDRRGDVAKAQVFALRYDPAKDAR